jgi:hypothetical protein
MMADDVSGYLIDGIITSVLVALVLGGLVGVVVQLLGRRVSSFAAGVLFVLALVAAPVAVARPARSSAVSSQGNRLVARRLAVGAQTHSTGAPTCPSMMVSHGAAR